PTKHPGLQVLAKASHYWPLEVVKGIRELWDKKGNRPDIVEGMVNKGILLDGDNGATFLHFGNYQNTCISDPTLCGPQGITFSFFWKNHEAESRFAVSSGGKVISNGFSVYTNPFVGYVEFYTRGNNHRWKTNISVPGPYWTHILFTWTRRDGLKVYINGTFTAADQVGKVSDSYGDRYSDLVIGTGNDGTYGHFASGAFDEFVIWEMALSPNDVLLYYKAATGRRRTAGPTNRRQEDSPHGWMDLVIYFVIYLDIYFVMYLVIYLFPPNRTMSQDAANNLTQPFLSVCLCLSVCLWSLPVQPQSTPVVSGLIETVDRVMEHMVTNLEPGPQSLMTLDGTSFVADYSLMKLPQNYNLQHYRFPPEGKSYISVPGEAFTTERQRESVSFWTSRLRPLFLSRRISEAVNFKDHKIQVASRLISLNVEPSPALSVNLSGAPLVRIVLTHVLTKDQQDQVQNQSNKVFLYCAFLDYSTNEGVWSNQGCVRSDGNMTYSVCLCNHLTNFAILMQVVSVSTICNQRYHIHANLSFAILVAEILLLISARFEPGTMPCVVMAVLLHFFFLSAFAWMLVEGLHLYSMVVKVFGSEGSKHAYYYGIGWGGSVHTRHRHCPLLVGLCDGDYWSCQEGFFVFLFHCLLNSEVRTAFKHKTKVWTLTSSSIRNVNVKPLNSDIMNANRDGPSPTKMNTWDKSSNSANRFDLTAI
uniref:Adhesion G protein-coupled receptor D1 n=1 Tax=Cynoglossus semilaevis TaxID=244447 RepID=A0A3P8WL92_CYNSE